MNTLQEIYETIARDGFSATAIQLIETLTNNILNGRTDFPRFNRSEHAGLCAAGAPLIGASIVASYVGASVTTGCNASGRPGSRPSNWQIDQEQEQLVEQWAKASKLWVEGSEQIITHKFGPMIAQGAESKVYFRDGRTSVVKERASIYSTTSKALDAIALHNYLFPDTAMHVIGFTRDSDSLFRIILTQPFTLHALSYQRRD